MTTSTLPERPTDHALAAAYAGGDEGAAAELVRRHADPLARFLHGAGAAADDVEDLVQETLFRAFRGLRGWRRDASFRSWLFTIGSNLLKDDARRRRGRQIVPLNDRDIAGTSDPHAELAAGEAEERMRRGLAGLSRLQRDVFLLRVQEGAAYEDIAAALGTTPGAARVHYHHAVKRLKELAR
jgi:RNA polymerase sigma-70 factor (ECF subfamily)